MRHPVDVILLDFARAFNKVRHNILISKLNSLDISAQPLDLIMDFLRIEYRRLSTMIRCQPLLTSLHESIKAQCWDRCFLRALSTTYLSKLRIVTSFYLQKNLKRLVPLQTAMTKTLSSRISIQLGAGRRQTIYRFRQVYVYTLWAT